MENVKDNSEDESNGNENENNNPIELIENENENNSDDELNGAENENNGDDESSGDENEINDDDNESYEDNSEWTTDSEPDGFEKILRFAALVDFLASWQSSSDESSGEDDKEDENAEDKSAEETEDEGAETASMSSFKSDDEKYLSQRIVGKPKKIKARCCSFTWNIKKFSKYIRAKKRDFIRTPKLNDTINQNELDCYIDLFPKGSSHKYKDYISLSISCYYGISQDKMIQYELSILDKNNRQVNKKKRILFNTSKVDWRDVKYDQFLERKWLMANKDELLPNDCLSIVLKINWSLTRNNYKHSCNSENYCQSSNSLLNLKLQFENAEFSDVKLISADGQIFQAHKVILAGKSPVFSAMFKYSCMQENKDNAVTIEDFTGDVLKEMLHFVYCGTISQINQVKNQQIFFDLIRIGDKYDIEGLENLSELEIKRSINIDNAMTILINSDISKAVNLKRMALDFISLKLDQVKSTEAFKSAEETHPELVQECKDLENEYSLIIKSDIDKCVRLINRYDN